MIGGTELDCPPTAHRYAPYYFSLSNVHNSNREAHLHGRQDTKRVTSLDFLSLLDTHIHHDTRHGRTNRPRVGRRLFSADVFDSRGRVFNDDGTGLSVSIDFAGLHTQDQPKSRITHLSVELEEDFTGTLFGIERADREHLDGEDFALLDGNGEFFSDFRLAEEEAGRNDTDD